MSFWMLLLIAWCCVALFMSGLWLVQLRLGDASIVDVAWPACIGLFAVAFACEAADGNPVRRVLTAVLAAAWALRLSAYIFSRGGTHAEDGRYQRLKEQWGERAQLKMFAFYQVQAIGAVVFAIPLLLAARNPAPLGPFDLLAPVVWLVSQIGETFADRQLGRFRADPANRGRVCQSGLWRYSRHPNYFFEWLHWWTYPLLALTGSYGWLALVGPLTMLYLLCRVSGIPPTEAQALHSRGEAYRTYQRTTSAFFPWPPREERPKNNFPI